MKKLAVIFLVLGIAITTHAQVRKIPATVTDAFKERYPNAVSVEWRDNLSNFSATFLVDSVKSEAKFDSKGKWQGTEFRISVETIPAEVMDGFKKSKYGDWTLKDARKMDLPDNVVKYRLQVEKTDINKRVLIFNNNGKLLKNDMTL